MTTKELNGDPMLGLILVIGFASSAIGVGYLFGAGAGWLTMAGWALLISYGGIRNAKRAKEASK